MKKYLGAGIGLLALILIGSWFATQSYTGGFASKLTSTVLAAVTSIPTTATTPKTWSQCGSVFAAPSVRKTTDLPDDLSGYQIHIIYAIPKDGTDHSYDTNGAIARSVSAWEYWMCQQTGGQGMRIDTHNGKLDVTFVKLPDTNQQIETGSDLPWKTNANSNPYVRDDLELMLKKLGFTDPHKLYAVYYDGASNYACGGGAWPPTLTGHVAAEYMQGGAPGYPPCQTNSLASNPKQPGYLDFDLIHEIMHTLGFVPSCAKHFTLAGHVSDSPNDLMYSGSKPWGVPNLVLDYGHDDYYKTGSKTCLDLTNSAFFSAGGTQLPPSW